jgi:hypothetical protein
MYVPAYAIEIVAFLLVTLCVYEVGMDLFGGKS